MFKTINCLKRIKKTCSKKSQTKLTYQEREIIWWLPKKPPKKNNKIRSKWTNHRLEKNNLVSHKVIEESIISYLFWSGNLDNKTQSMTQNSAVSNYQRRHDGNNDKHETSWTAVLKLGVAMPQPEDPGLCSLKGHGIRKKHAIPRIVLLWFGCRSLLPVTRCWSSLPRGHQLLQGSLQGRKLSKLQPHLV